VKKLIPYINIHTHHLSKDNGVFLFNNRFGFDKENLFREIFFYWHSPVGCGFTSIDAELEKNIQHPNCLAIGECGLDKVIEIDLELQKKVFISQLELAVKYQKTVIIHCVKAFDELIEICKLIILKFP
jgi:TatD DNase family protein